MTPDNAPAHGCGAAMKCVSRLSVVLVLAACAVAPKPDQGLGGLWTLRIRDLNHREVSVATIRFTGEAAPSCMGGNWKRVIVESITATDEKFFPLSDPLSYTIEGSGVIVGRNEVCDGYLRLHGNLEGGKIHGPYDTFSKGGGEVLGDFTLERAP